ncbi:hypothetical protein MINTM016_31520 [Mycobacterium intracellulare]|nr:hypothetical protein MINTM016_31520 [Mycobacterium intracellulare]
MTCATSSAAGPAATGVAGCGARAGSSTSTIGPPNSPSRERNSALVTTARMPASATMKPIRAAGTAGSIGT